MTRKKRPYIPPRPAPTPAAPGDTPNPQMNRAVSINLQATTGRADIHAGLRVRVAGGLYEGEVGTVESMVGGVIPAAVVRTEAGKVRRIRTVDLAPAPAQARAPEPAPESPPN